MVILLYTLSTNLLAINLLTINLLEVYHGKIDESSWKLG